MENKAYRQTLRLLKQKKVAVFIVLYNSERFITSVLARIPKALRSRFAEIYVIDDSSSDASYQVAQKAKRMFGLRNVRVLRTPYNRGYGGNQKLGYRYAIVRQYDIVVLLHGDGQYAPESLPDILAPFTDRHVDAVFGSRMLSRQHALKGGMPLYKWVGNIILTGIENILLRTRFSEFHSGYRAYRVDSLKKIPFEKNTDGFHFDTEIIVQLLAAGGRIREVPIPTYYGQEICHVNGLSYAWHCLRSVMEYRVTRLGIFYEPKYDIAAENSSLRTEYLLKKEKHTVHYDVLHGLYDKTKTGIDLGSHEGLLSSLLAKKMKRVVSVDITMPTRSYPAVPHQADLDEPFAKKLGPGKYDYVFALDVIEHLKDPDSAVGEIYRLLKPTGTLYASTGNVAFIVTRLSLFFGMFNYGRRGILDLTHKRLFTVYSFRKLLTQNGFRVRRIRYYPPPLVDYTKGNGFMKAVDRVLHILAQLYPPVFAYQFLIEAERLDSAEEIYARTFRGG